MTLKRLSLLATFQKDTVYTVQLRNFESPLQNISDGVYIPLCGNISYCGNPFYNSMEILMELNLKMIDI